MYEVRCYNCGCGIDLRDPLLHIQRYTFVDVVSGKGCSYTNLYFHALCFHALCVHAKLLEQRSLTICSLCNRAVLFDSRTHVSTSALPERAIDPISKQGGALVDAVFTRDKARVEPVLQGGGEIPAHDLSLAFRIAASIGCESIVDRLFQTGKITREDMADALVLARANFFKRVERYVFSRLPGFTELGRALVNCVRKGDPSRVEAILQEGRSSSYATAAFLRDLGFAFMVGASIGCEAIVRQLFESGEISLEDMASAWNLSHANLHTAIERYISDRLPTSERGCRLVRAVQVRNFKCAASILQEGEIPAHDLDIAFHKASSMGCREIVEQLFQTGKLFS